LLSEEEGIDFREGVLHAGYFRTNNQFALVINNRKGIDNSSKSSDIVLSHKQNSKTCGEEDYVWKYMCGCAIKKTTYAGKCV
jgi:hypothetical protein